MLIRRMTEADAGAVSALITRSYDQVLVHYHSPEMLARFREHATPESLVEQLGRKEFYVVEDQGRLIASGGLGWIGTERRVTDLFVAVDLIGRGVGRLLLDHLVSVAKDEGARRLHVASVRNAVTFYERAGFVPDPDPPAAIPEITWLALDL